MTSALIPADETDVAEAVAGAKASLTPLSVVGGGSRAGLGRPTQTAATLATSALVGVTLYEPSELVLSARAGTPLIQIDRLLAKQGQRLPFEPMDHRRLFGGGGEPTIGGVVAANISGPRRIQAGAARDSLIGLRAVTGDGEIVKSGGRVMKNVTGYDLVKFIAGSYGTLAVVTEVTFKVLPSPETEATLVLSGLDDETAVKAMAAALGSPYSVTGAGHRPATDHDPARTFVRLEGFVSSVVDRSHRLATELASFGKVGRVDSTDSSDIWKKIRDVDLPGVTPDTPIWRLSMKPSDGPQVVGKLHRLFDCRILFDWGGGLVWLAGGEGKDAGAKFIRRAVASVGGHATLVRAPDDIRAAVEVFQPLDPALMALSKKLKQTFDPVGILNPGRMYAGI
jgi:glycolate dehydrogenase FAD-binding subunit